MSFNIFIIFGAQYERGMFREEYYTIEDLIQGDQKAFRAFHQKHVKLFCQFGLRFIDDLEVVRDIVQESFIAMWDRINTFREEAHVKAFLYATIRNKAINYLRDRKIEERNIGKLFQLQDDCVFRNIAIEEEMYDFLCKKIERLPPMQREVLWMHIDGYSNEEIAKKLNITTNTVLTHKQRAKSELKSYLTAFDFCLCIFL